MIRPALKVEWAQFEALAALRCTGGVAVPLVAGLVIDQPLVGVFGAAGALGVGFGSFQGAYRGRAELMLLAALAMAFSVFVGSLAGASTVATIVIGGLWAFGGGLLVALGPGASFVGLQSIVAVLIAGGYPSDIEGAAARAALVLAGGLTQTLLLVVIWPFRRFTVERRSLAAVYRNLAAYARTIPARQTVPPEPHTFASTPSPSADPQPFARSGEVFVFQALLDEAERIRASLAALAIHYERLDEADQAAASALAGLSAHALDEIASALGSGREPREPSGLSQSIADCVSRPSCGTAFEPLLRQIRAAWRTAGVLTANPGHLTARPQPAARRRRRRPLRDALITLRSNLTIRSTACRHAFRLAVVLTMAAAATRVPELPRGYWLPLTIALVLKPEFHDTFAFSIGRVAGTVLGAAGATLVAHAFLPGPNALVVLVLGFAWVAYGFVGANYAAVSVGITAYVVFLMILAGVPEVTAAADRIVYTVVGGVLALGAYIVWPTWTATEARPALARMLETQADYLGSLLAAYALPATPNLQMLDEQRASARLARSNAEAVVERMLGEPRSRGTIRPRTAAGIVGATRRNALAALSLHAGLERDMRPAVPDIRAMASQVTSSLLTLATAMRRTSAPPVLPPLRETQRALMRASDAFIIEETDLILDSIDTIAELLTNEARRRAGAPPDHPRVGFWT